MKNIQNGVYLHYKGNLYAVLTTATHSETHEKMVVYQSMSDKQEVWVRPASMFADYVDMHDRSIPRFRFIRSIMENELL